MAAADGLAAGGSRLGRPARSGPGHREDHDRDEDRGGGRGDPQDSAPARPGEAGTPRPAQAWWAGGSGSAAATGMGVASGTGRHALEHLAVRGVEVEHRRGPLRCVAGQQALARARDRLVDRHTVGQRRIELAGERRRGTVADGELHGDDRGAVLLDEPLGHPAERVGRAEPSGLAGVEEDQSQRVVVVEVGPENPGRDGDAAAVLVAEVEDPFLLSVVVVTVPDDVQDVDLVRAQPRRKVGRSR